MTSTPEYGRFAKLKFSPFRPFRRWMQYGVVRCFLFLAEHLPVSLCQWLGRMLVYLALPLLPREWAICIYQLKLAYPELSSAERKRLAVRAFQNMGMTFWESLAIARIRRNAEHWLSLEGEQDLQEAYRLDRGVVLITGHMANWELFSIAFERLRIPAQTVVRGIVNTRLNRLMSAQRQSEYLRVVERGSRESPRQLLHCLKHHEVLLLALDHDVDVPGVFVDFFGIPANTPRVAASLALKMGVPVVSGFGRRLPDGTHQIIFRRILPPPGIVNDEEGVRCYTQLFSNAIEAQIRISPEQWSWNHRRWKRRPTSPAPTSERSARRS